MRNLTQIDLRELVPESIRDDANVSAAIDALNGELQLVSALVEVPSILARIDELEDDVLDHLAWQLNSKTWRDSWPLSLKRSVIKSLIIEQSKKGTRFALDKAVRSYGAGLTIREWWETSPPGVPHTFDLVLSINNLGGQVSDAQAQEDLLRRIDDVKPVRSKYTFTLAVQAEGGIGITGAFRTASYVRLSFTEDTDQPIIINEEAFVLG